MCVYVPIYFVLEFMATHLAGGFSGKALDFHKKICEVFISAGALLRFFVVLISALKNSETVTKLCNDGFLSNPFQFIIHILSYHLALHGPDSDSRKITNNPSPSR
jgi:hypothetical protein